jgi:competence protein ComFA
MNELENYHGRLFTKYQLTSEEREKAKRGKAN